MTGAIMQPTFLPWIGYFAMIDSVDKFVFLDHVQLAKRSWQVRNKIKNKSMDTEQMLTVPVIRRSRDSMMINNTSILDSDWKKKHLEAIYCNYHKTLYFPEVYEIIQSAYNSGIQVIGEFNGNLISKFCTYLGINTELKYSSQIAGLEKSKDELLVEICQKEGIDTYLSALGSAQYIEKDTEGGAFTQSGIKLLYQNYQHPIYGQVGEQFISHLGIIDLLFQHGHGSIDIIRGGVNAGYTSKEVALLLSS